MMKYAAFRCPPVIGQRARCARIYAHVINYKVHYVIDTHAFHTVYVGEFDSK